MSEPASLYARFTLSHEQYEAFMNSAPARPSAFADWQSWFDRREMSGGNRVPPEILADLDAVSVADVIKAWRADAWTGTPPIEYDEIRRTLRIAMLQASENYHEMLRLLAPLRGAARFNEPGADDFVVILDFLWGDGDINAYLRFGDGASRFDEACAPEHLDEARGYLREALDYLQSRAG
ncbi:hypothetical protein J5226_19695 [Lysobacter sp. K5869]|uniref:hypothetical protein n=1 Tax=Lysobacter sp. K5869 TaxID=2820808 RepID=UPI001C06441E|nr:hypothetical protein [Lysobacter sp. K5869]QWP75810.1 hypothetical protein J5226_19695 [Lysobacter sp. K5869]